MAIAYVGFGILWTSLTKDSKGAFPHLRLQVLLDNLTLGGGIITPSGISSLKLFIKYILYLCYICI